MALNKTGPENKERIKAAAIVRDGVTHQGGKSHYQLRQSINADGNGERREPDDIEGFISSSGRFLTRQEAIPVGVACGQLRPMWKDAGRELLSSDIDW